MVVSDDRPLGRVGVAVLDDGSLAVSWLERAARGLAEVRVRNIRPGGPPGSSVKLDEVGSGRESGVPVMARAGKHVVVAWTRPEDGPRLGTALVLIQR